MIIYADFNCPYCYLASQRADALMRLGGGDVDWRAVEHDPGLPMGGRRTEPGRPRWDAEMAELAGHARPGIWPGGIAAGYLLVAVREIALRSSIRRRGRGHGRYSFY